MFHVKHDDVAHGWLGASPDGLIGGLEIGGGGGTGEASVGCTHHRPLSLWKGAGLVAGGWGQLAPAQRRPPCQRFPAAVPPLTMAAGMLAGRPELSARGVVLCWNPTHLRGCTVPRCAVLWCMHTRGAVQSLRGAVLRYGFTCCDVLMHRRRWAGDSGGEVPIQQGKAGGGGTAPARHLVLHAPGTARYMPEWCCTAHRCQGSCGRGVRHLKHPLFQPEFPGVDLKPTLAVPNPNLNQNSAPPSLHRFLLVHPPNPHPLSCRPQSKSNPDSAPPPPQPQPTPSPGSGTDGRV